MKVIKTLATVVVAGLAIWIWRAPLYAILMQSVTVLFPCRAAITYRLGSIDPQFNLPTSTAIADMREAAQLWDDEHKDLLAYDPDHGAVVINFAYDTRQQTTQKLNALNGNVSSDRTAYDALKSQYGTLYADYITKKASFESANTAFNQEAARYQTQVDAWNARGGAPKDVYDQLQTEKAHLFALQDQLHQSQTQVNAAADQINAMVGQLNAMARSLNLAVDKYNTVGAATGGEFEQGVYESSLGVRTITIFEYENHAKLVRVLAHEMGHAIGLEHVDDNYAIMAAINEGSQVALRRADVAELDRVCAQDPVSILKTKLSDYFTVLSGKDE